MWCVQCGKLLRWLSNENIMSFLNLMTTKFSNSHRQNTGRDHPIAGGRGLILFLGMKYTASSIFAVIEFTHIYFWFIYQVGIQNITVLSLFLPVGRRTQKWTSSWTGHLEPLASACPLKLVKTSAIPTPSTFSVHQPFSLSPFRLWGRAAALRLQRSTTQPSQGSWDGLTLPVRPCVSCSVLWRLSWDVKWPG